METLEREVGEDAIEVVTAEFTQPRSRHDLVVLATHPDEGRVEGASTEVIHDDVFTLAVERARVAMRE